MSSADTAWLLVSTALVLLMTPALGFFDCLSCTSDHRDETS